MTFDADFSRAADLYARLGDIQPNAATYSRRVVIMLLDVSASMSFTVADERGAGRPRRRIDLLNEQLHRWLPSVREEGRGQLRDVEMAVITFSGRGVHPVTGDASRPRDQWHEDGGVFVRSADLDLGELEAFGTTPMVTAINLALDLSDARTRYLARQNLQTGQVRILMFGDGGSYDKDLPSDAWRTAAQRIDALRDQRRVQFFAFGAPGADESVLRALAGNEGYVPLVDFDFERLLDLILRATSADDPFEAIREQFGWEEPGT